MPKDEEESELEEEVEEVESEKETSNQISSQTIAPIEVSNIEEVDEERFQQFMQPISTENFSPTLEQINQPIPTPNLEQDIAFTPTQEETSTKYDFTTEEEAKRYKASSRGIEPPVLTPRETSQRVRLLNPLERRNIPRADDMQPRMFGTRTTTQKRKLPFEKDDDKYKEVKL